MAEPHVISGLKAKQEEIKKRISDLKKLVREAQQELSTISKTLRIFGENPRTGGDKLFLAWVPASAGTTLRAGFRAFQPIRRFFHTLLRGNDAAERPQAASNATAEISR